MLRFPVSPVLWFSPVSDKTERLILYLDSHNASLPKISSVLYTPHGTMVQEERFETLLRWNSREKKLHEILQQVSDCDYVLFYIPVPVNHAVDSLE